MSGPTKAGRVGRKEEEKTSMSTVAGYILDLGESARIPEPWALDHSFTVTYKLNLKSVQYIPCNFVFYYISFEDGW